MDICILSFLFLTVLCKGCIIDRGIGYNPDPDDCSKYVQCYLQNGEYHTQIMPCPFGTFWDQSTITCIRSSLVNCPVGKFHFFIWETNFRFYYIYCNVLLRWEPTPHPRIICDGFRLVLASMALKMIFETSIRFHRYQAFMTDELSERRWGKLTYLGYYWFLRWIFRCFTLPDLDNSMHIHK